ncbi:FAD-dependent oxidoreductase [Mesorhizobium sp. SB112]|uniref:NAD(P)/FAD-dependent oxidoreductase n=1 Tax=Mesorhizobium sp. SB112 TaxID=3151853 RepID=UPI003265485F
MNENGVVIVGSGHAGVQVAASLREEGYEGPVILVGDEADAPYHKPPLSKAFIKDVEAKPQLLRGDVFYTGNAIDLRLGERVERIDTQAKRLELAGGSTIPFDHLVLATGSRPRILPVEGAKLDGVVSLRSLSDARTIRELSGKTEDVVILGGGFIGLEIAATLRIAGRRVTVVEAQNRLLGRAVAPVISSHVHQRLEGLGVRILLDTTVDFLEGNGIHVSGVLLSTGEKLPAGMVVVGIGVVPNVELAEQAGLNTGNGIKVDGQMRTSQAGILSIGDVANYRHWFTGQDVRLESVQNATDQARLAARTIVGHAASYDSVPWFWSDIGDMKLQMVGLASGGDSHVVTGDAVDNKFSVFHYAGDRLIAIESVNRPTDHMLGRKMMQVGFLPSRDLVAAGSDGLKQALAEWQAKPAV